MGTAPTATRDRVLAALRATAEPHTLGDLAGALDVHVNTVRFHVGRLVAAGLAERVEAAPSGPGRPAVRVCATARRESDSARSYRSLAQALTSALANEPGRAASAERAGRAWGHRLAEELSPTDPDAALLHVLTDLNFAPAAVSSTEVELHNCPFLEVATAAPDIVCSVHLGLMRGALDAVESKTRVVGLDPLVRPGLCVAHLDRGRHHGSAT